MKARPSSAHGRTTHTVNSSKADPHLPALPAQCLDKADSPKVQK